MKETENSGKLGILSGMSAYLLWGILPIYWKWLDHIPSSEVLAHRIVWSLIFMTFLLLFLGKGIHFLKEFQTLFMQPKMLLGMIMAAILISTNWYTYIWAVTNDHVVEASLGYYINPLVSVLLGVVFLKEKLSKTEWLSVLLAALAVLVLTLSLGVFPVVSLCLAFSFGLYGLIKKLIPLSAMNSVAIETLLVIPFAVTFLMLQHGLSNEMFYWNEGNSFWLLMGAGAATATPLLLFAAGAKRIPLTLMGFLQYIAPTIMLILGIIVYNESFTTVHFVSFSIIWIALTIFTASKYRHYKKLVNARIVSAPVNALK